MPASQLKAEIARILEDEGYIQGFKLIEDAAPASRRRKTLRLFLKYGPHGERVITGIERISRPGRRVYFGREDVPDGARRARHQHPDDVARRDDRPRRRSRPASAAKCSATSGKATRKPASIAASRAESYKEQLTMSRIGKKPIPLPKGVTVKVDDGAVEVQGPKGKLKQALPAGINFELADGQLHAKRSTDDPELAKFHGLARSLVANAVTGVTDGFKRELDIVGVGYRAELKGKQMIFALGYSHAVVFDIPTGIDIAIDKQTHITVTGVDRQLVGQVAANMRRLRKPDPYKQKGVRYTGEVLKKKAGKTGAKYGHAGRSRSNETRSPPPDPAAAAQADFRARRAAAAQRVPQRDAHLRPGHRRPDRQDAGVGLERGAGVKGDVRGRARRQLKGAEAIGKAIAERSIEKGIKRVVFDRSGFLYHGRVRAVADAARKAGLEF